jgi:hypothetical protein
VEKFPVDYRDGTEARSTLAGTGTKRRAGGEGAGAHAEAGAERRRDVAEEVTAAGAVAVAAEGSGEIGAHPLAAGLAERVDALHGETGQILHVVSLSGRARKIASPLAADPHV